MDRVNLIASRPLKYKGTQFQTGEAFTATRSHARALKAIKRAIDAPAAVPDHAPEANTYATKDMVADPPSNPDDTTSTPSTSRRAYRRRDLTPKP
jgi:hypothetical protein